MESDNPASKHETKADIVVVGSCMIDLVSYVPRLPLPGETIHGSRFHQGFGGKGANQCVAAAKLGASTALVAKLGSDSFGQTYLDELRKYKNINTSHVLRVPDSTSSGMASITVSSSTGENQIVIVPGANLTLCEGDIDAAFDLLKHSKVVVFQGETPWSTTRYCLDQLQGVANVISIVNVAPAPSEVTPDLLQVLTQASIVCVNEIEAELLTGIKPDTQPRINECLAKLGELGVRVSVVTLGGQGVAYASREDGVARLETVDAVERPVDTTGAGDCFLGALAFYLCYFGSPPLLDVSRLRHCLSRACAIARLSVMQCGTQESFPSRSDLNASLFASQKEG